MFSRTLRKLLKLIFCRASLSWLLLLLDENSRNYGRCIKQTLPQQFSILINESGLREIDLHETSERTALIEQTLAVRGTPFLCST